MLVDQTCRDTTKQRRRAKRVTDVVVRRGDREARRHYAGAGGSVGAGAGPLPTLRPFLAAEAV
ncbi:MAG: hypothetical protein H8F28_21895 [Fibrella sp.]|nr:hypothetical protein [Armatimonadota bacterium]